MEGIYVDLWPQNELITSHFRERPMLIFNLFLMFEEIRFIPVFSMHTL